MLTYFRRVDSIAMYTVYSWTVQQYRQYTGGQYSKVGSIQVGSIAMYTVYRWTVQQSRQYTGGQYGSVRSFDTDFKRESWRQS